MVKHNDNSKEQTNARIKGELKTEKRMKEGKSNNRNPAGSKTLAFAAFLSFHDYKMRKHGLA